MHLIVLLHFVAGLGAPWLVGRLGTRAFAVLAAVPAGSLVWAVAHTGAVREGDGPTDVLSWVPSLDLEVALTMGVLQWLMFLVVVGIGALVLAHCTWYFTDDDEGIGTFAGVLVAFVGAMLGLVLADDLLLLYVFWELTTVFSYLLIGYDPTKTSSRRSALQALLVTTFGGLAMLVGLLVIGHEAGTLRISEILADPPGGTSVTIAVALLLVGALSKSALFPFHFWLPGAMAAPTPVSAYLHAAAMVKAGVYLVALLAPAFSTVAGWHASLLVLGVLTMVLGGLRSLRQYDVKLLLAYGTVSQLGFLMVVLSIGTRHAALAGLALLLAHALFKATLFLVVGIVDKSTGTRDLRKLSGLGRRQPVLLTIAGLAALSMAGVVPLLGFVAKESSFEALVDVAETGTELPAWAGWLAVAGVVVGSVLTVAYTARFVWGTFADKPAVEDTPLTAPGVGFQAAPAVLALTGLVLGFAGSPLTSQLAPYVDQFPAAEKEPYLALWHGVGLPLLFSVLAVGVGLLMFWKRERFARAQARVTTDLSTERGYGWTMRAVDRVAVEVTGWVQRGSVAAYLAIILVVVIGLPGMAALLNVDPDDLRVVLWDSPAQAAVGLVIVVAAVMTARSRRRLRAVVLVGVTGYGTALLFLLHGAPDLALTQVLVETVSLVVFVLVLRRLPEYFTDRPLTWHRYLRIALGVGVAAGVTGFMLLTTSARTHDPVSVEFAEQAVEYGGGENIVNVTLVDIRAWDTFGEISVLVAAATGVASLIFLDTRLSGIRRVREIPYPVGVTKQRTTAGRRAWLPAPRTLDADRRSIVFEVVTRLVFHSIVVFSIYLLLAGHNQPGGGFAAGLVTGVALIIRYLAGGKYELDEAAPVDAGILMGSGLGIAATSAVVPLFFGGAVLQSAIVDVSLGPLGKLHLVSSTVFDIGVYLIVVALILDLLRTFGSRIDRQIQRERREAEGSPA
ncbi:multicomponent Na+:H+ antiporter subunit A [Nocardioides sp. J9]|uniref:Na+/H+ antiporter subunit A n=1 Tax=Nocardioides sp. J9 TaxID=935844 RepID=UPI0011AA2A70|nr:Na+/H+ antiporter subunit A [Nocardioides sp. J9]TWG96353.1 multicomponent Na+:H+ antiporter subunit A [Nocardioides sp. J9]